MTRPYIPWLSAAFSPVLLHPGPSHGPSGTGLPTCPLFSAYRSFHSGQCLLSNDHTQTQTHYEILNVPHDASVADIKRSFYKLSKAHHPDHHPQDPHAPRRFIRISEAYAILGHPDKRALYDRDVMRHHHHHYMHARHGKHAPSAGPRANASYHSTGPAGGRPASGLSRRRGTFKGPPPSFFRNAGGGGAAQAGQAGTGGASGSSSGTGGASFRAGFGTGFGPGNANVHDTGTRSNPDTPHFDKASTERTYRRLDERFAARRAGGDMQPQVSDPSMAAGFFVICAAIVAGVIAPAMVYAGGKRKKTKPDKT